MRRSTPSQSRRAEPQPPAPSLEPQLVFFGGKGGVGKTTMAAAWAMEEARAGRRVLVVSTDPAHSLGDALGARLSPRASTIRAGRSTLHAVELDAPGAYARWLRDHRQALGEAIEHGTWLDREDIEQLLELSIPGVDELVGLFEIARLAGMSLTWKSATPRSTAPKYDMVVVDTAPTGHALRLLAAPATVAAVAEAVDDLQQEHRVIRQQLARVSRPEAADRLAAVLAEQARAAAALLRDRRRTSFHWVLLPEALSIAETEDGLRALRRAGIHVPGLIVNRVLPDGGPCPICDRRRAAEREAIARIAALKPRHDVRVVRAQPREPRGVAALARIGRELRSSTADLKVRTTRDTASLKARTTSAVVQAFPPPLASRNHRELRRDLAIAQSAKAGRPAVSLDDARPTIAAEEVQAFRGARLLFFGGKGGVGKTTVAATAAIRIARTQRKRRVLLISTDPAHSLGDVLDARVSNRAAPVPRGPRNLHVRELDAAAALAARRGDLEAALNEIAAALGSDTASAGEGGVQELMELAPPGIDELLGILEVAEMVRLKPDPTYDVVVVDTAPTGHALRLLEMPDAAREWVQVLLRVLLKYRQLVRPGQLASELVQLSKSIRALREQLDDPTASRFIVVTRAAALPRLETSRLVARLRRLRLAAPAVVVNALTLAPGRCRWCRAAAASETRELAQLVAESRRRAGECAIIQTPLAAPAPRGIAALERWGSRWRLTSTV